MTRQIRKLGSKGSKQPNNKRNFVSKTNTGCRTSYRTSPKLCLTDSEVKTKHEWLPNAPTRPLRRKLYKNSARPRHRETKTKTGTVKTKATKIKTKLKSLVSRKCHPQPPLSKFSNLKTRRLCYLRRHSESSSSSGNSVLEEKANAFRKRRDFYFYKYHKYESDNSS
ncbi:hypothetical protein M8J75_005753 [Diaphorina citri]|nr:hypothetical protein M8J75_005753 [Diaphorina citri]